MAAKSPEAKKRACERTKAWRAANPDKVLEYALQHRKQRGKSASCLPRQAGDTDTGVPQIEVTPEMIRAGQLELAASYGEEGSAYVVSAIYEAMEAARLRALSGKPPTRRRKR
jgi:hypothetical protein